MQCRYCRVLQQLEGRRFYRDGSSFPYIIVENLRTLTPILIYKSHGVKPPDLRELVSCFADMNSICQKLFGARYTLRVEDLQSHFAIHSIRILSIPDENPGQEDNVDDPSSCVLAQEVCV